MPQSPKSFFEVLEDQIRTDLRREIEAEVRSEQERQANLQNHARVEAEAGRLATWLASHTNAFSFARKSPYANAKRATTPQTPGRIGAARVAAPATEIAIQITTVEDLCALELIARNCGKKFGTSLTETELKSAWRKAAMRTHPDRFIGSDPLVQMRQAALFREIASAYETLSRHFEAHAA